MQGKCARINARLNRADLITADAAGRYVGDGVDDGTHRNPPLAVRREAKTTGWTYVRAATGYSFSRRHSSSELVPQGNLTVIGCRSCPSRARNLNTTVLFGAGQRTWWLLPPPSATAQKDGCRIDPRTKERFALASGNF